jgi:glyoxylase-like metal-dependent hydrolase (beta-lactamase superfamily II)
LNRLVVLTTHGHPDHIALVPAALAMAAWKLRKRDH